MTVFSRLLPSVLSAYGLQTGSHAPPPLPRTAAEDSTSFLIALALIFVPQANEKYYDLGGALGFLSTTFVSLYYPAMKDKFYLGKPGPLPALSSFAPRQLLLSACLGVWSIRLGSYLLQVREYLCCVDALVLMRRHASFRGP